MAIISGVGSIPRKREESGDVENDDDDSSSCLDGLDVMEKEDGLDVIGGCEERSFMLPLEDVDTSVE